MNRSRALRNKSRVVPASIAVAVATLLLGFLFGQAQRGQDARDFPPKGFVYLAEQAPDIVIDLRYAGNDNFTGRPVRGYEASRCILSGAAANALMAVQNDLRRYGYGLKVFDGYRPQQAVDHFVRWTQTRVENVLLKERYFPDIAKGKLIEQGYIAAKSGHSRGSSVDVTIVLLPGSGDPKAKEPQELDMGTRFDFFGRESHSESRTPTPQQRLHRLLLRSIMEKHGFSHLLEEWWHFTLKDEPFPDTYFNFPVR